MLCAVAQRVDASGRVSLTHDEWSEYCGLSGPQVYRALAALKEFGAVAEVVVRKQPMTKLTAAGKRLIKSRNRDSKAAGHEIVTSRDKRSPARARDSLLLSDYITEIGMADDSVDVADVVCRRGWERRTEAKLPKPVLGSSKNSFVALRKLCASLLDADYDPRLIEDAIASNDGAWTRNALLETMRRSKQNQSPRERINRTMSGGGAQAVMANSERLARLAKGERLARLAKGER